jgi:FMN phosphatase YigB (HAD superfamily)/DNA-binding XRE family transcriptional regulator
MDEKALGKRLQLARRRAGLTQQELCQKAGLSYSTLAKIERGAIRSPSVFTVAAISQATNIPLESLLNIQPAGLNSPTLTNPKKRSKSGVTFVYFDVNGVLVRFFHKAFTEIARISNKPTDIIETLYWRYNDAAISGQMSMDEFNAILGKAFDIQDFDWSKHYFNNIEAMPGVNEVVEWASEHFEVGLISNNMPGFIDRLIRDKIIPDINYKVIVDSSKAGVIKPDAKIYQIAQELAAVDSKEILTIDDSRSNLVVADRAGWHVVWFDEMDPAESVERIRQALEF